MIWWTNDVTICMKGFGTHNRRCIMMGIGWDLLIGRKASWLPVLGSGLAMLYPLEHFLPTGSEQGGHWLDDRVLCLETRDIEQR